MASKELWLELLELDTGVLLEFDAGVLLELESELLLVGIWLELLAELRGAGCGWVLAIKVFIGDQLPTASPALMP